MHRIQPYASTWVSWFSNLPKVWKKRAYGLGLVGFVWLGSMVAQAHPVLVEQYYSQRAYPRIASILSGVNRWVGFSIGEWFYAAVIVGLLGWVMWLGKQVVQKHLRPRHAMGQFFWGGIWILGIGWFWFEVIWGLNYSRQPIHTTLKLTRSQPEPSILVELCQLTIAQTNANYRQLQPQSMATQPSQLPYSSAQLIDHLDQSFQCQTWLGPVANVKFGPPKPVLSSRLMSYSGISGVYCPFTGESNYNADLPKCELPFTIAHEMAHQRGFALENEANFIAFLVCRDAQDPYCRYAGFLAVSQYLLNEIELPQGEMQTLMNQFEAGPRQDLKAIRTFWKYYHGPWRRISSTLNDAYLKANNVSSGVKSYSRVVTLLTDYYRAFPQSFELTRSTQYSLNFGESHEQCDNETGDIHSSPAAWEQSLWIKLGRPKRKLNPTILSQKINQPVGKSGTHHCSGDDVPQYFATSQFGAIG